LIFSGGANLGFFHYCVLKTLYEENLLPRIIAGSSVGSIVASILCSRKWEEVPELLIPENIKIGAFHRRNNKYSWIRKIKRLLREGVLLDVNVVRDVIRDNIGDITFQEAYDRTGWILNITVTGYGEHDGFRLLNYLTAPHVVIWSAVCASCGLPYIYGPCDLYYKNEEGVIEPYRIGNRKYIDGSIGADLPMQNLSELFNVNYFIVSQTNPWVVPFLNESEVQRHTVRAFFSKIYEIFKDIIGSEIRFRVNQLTKLGILPRALTRYFNLITQEYGGHITIWPNPSLYDFLHILDNPTHEWIRTVLARGAQRTYQKVNHIAAVLVIERALEINYRYVKSLREKNLLTISKSNESEEDETEFADISSGDVQSIPIRRAQKSLSRRTKLNKNGKNRLSSFDLLKFVDDQESG